MPVIYQATCSACEYKSPLYSEGYLAVILDEPSSSMHAHPDDPRLVILAHPAESSILDELGFDYKSAAIGGRLLYVRNVVCRSCGTMYEVRRIGGGAAAIGGIGCSIIMGLAICASAMIGWQHKSVWVGFLCGCLVLLGLGSAFEFALSRFVRWRHKARIAEFDRGAGCAKCGCKDYSSCTSLLSRKRACPQCGKRAVRVRAVGIS